MNARWLEPVLFLVGLFGLVYLLSCCAGAAEATYGAQLAKCVKQAETREESRACRDSVDRAWGVYTVTERDGGR